MNPVRFRLPLRAKFRTQSGLTLIELLVALAIFSIVGLGALRMLDHLLLSSEKQRVATEQLAKLQTAVHLIDEDFHHWINRSIVDENDIEQMAITTDEIWCSLCLSRLGWFDPDLGVDSALQRVGYQLKSNSEGMYSLKRILWDRPDRTSQTEKTEQLILDQVERMTWEFVTDLGQRTSRWPAIEEEAGNLIGIQMSLQLQNFGTIVRLYPMIPSWQVTDAI